MTEDAVLTPELALIREADAADLGDQAELRSLVRSILVSEGATGDWEVAVALVSDDELRTLHQRFMGIDEPTDVMTFPYGEGMPGGDIAISVDHARARAEEWEHTPAQEVEFLVAHGVLHLLGWQDTSPEQRTAMLRRQEELLTRWRSEASL